MSESAVYKVRVKLRDGTGVLLYLVHTEPVPAPAVVADATSPVERIDVVPVADSDHDSLVEGAGGFGFKAWLDGLIPDGGEHVAMELDDDEDT